MEIVKLIGADVLPDYQKLILEVAKVIRVGFLQQNAFHKDDTYVPMEKQFKMMEVILYLYKKAKNLVDFGVPVNFIRETGLFDSISDEEIAANAGKTYQDVTALRDPLLGLSYEEGPDAEADERAGGAGAAADDRAVPEGRDGHHQ